MTHSLLHPPSSYDSLSSLGHASTPRSSDSHGSAGRREASCGGSPHHTHNESPPPPPAGRSKRRSRDGVDGEKHLVLTPWYPGGLPKGGARLCTEIRDFATFAAVADFEEAARMRAVDAIRAWLQQLWPQASVDAYGSFAYGTSMPSSAVDVMADGCGDLGRLREHDQPLGPDYSVGQVHLRTAPGSEAPTAAFVVVQGPGAVTVNLSMVTGQSQAQSAARMVRGWMREFPAAARVSITIRHVLGQARSADVRTGGLSSYCVLLMAVHICRRVDDPTDDAKVLAAFLADFGHRVSYQAEAISPTSAHRLRRSPIHARDQIVVLDPLDAASNLASGCTRLHCVQAQFQYCLMALQRWDRGAPRKGYKGRTPLSALVSHQPLWARAELLAEHKAMQDTDDAPPPLAGTPTSTPAATPQSRHLPDPVCLAEFAELSLPPALSRLDA